MNVPEDNIDSHLFQILEDMITFQVHSSLVSNLVGTIVEGKPIEWLMFTISLFLNTLQSGFYPSISKWAVQAVSTNPVQLVVDVWSRGGVKHTHIVRISGELLIVVGD
ncbi:MAG: hypothetical protein ACTSPB_13555 [Candidatus Thorarchaeota archaeon]